MGESVRKDKKIVVLTTFVHQIYLKIQFGPILVLFFAFFVLNTEFFDTTPPPHALHIWNAQDLYFHKTWVNRCVFMDKNGVVTTFVHQIYLKIPILGCSRPADHCAAPVFF
jgi:hypothetical protein